MSARDKTPATIPPPPPGSETTTVAGGCFWCIEGVYTRMKGVNYAISGYTAGHVANPTYEQICGGDTGHAEAVLVNFDPAVLTLEKVLEVLFKVHDPTTLNRQGNDVGTQYRSAIYYHTPAQKAVIEAFIKAHQPAYKSPIVTEVAPASVFYPAENYHQDYYTKNPEAGYCRVVVGPKVKKAEAAFPALMK